MAKEPSIRKKANKDDLMKERIDKLEERLLKLEMIIHDITSGHDVIPVAAETLPDGKSEP